VSSLVVSGPAGKYLTTQGQTVQFSSVEKSALVAQIVAVSPVAEVLQVVDETGQSVRLVAKAYGAYAGTDFVLVMGPSRIAELVGQDRQPVVILPVAAGSLVP
jgi:hypothetical protein